METPKHTFAAHVGSAARTVQVNGDYSVLLSGARVGALMQRVSSNNQSQAFLHTLVCSAIVDEATTDGCIGDGRLRVSPSSQLLRRDATYDRFVGVPERRAVCNVRTATVQPQCDRALPACDETCGNVDTSLCALRCTSTSACEWVCPAANCTCVAGRSVEAHCVFPKQCTTDCDDPVCRYDCGAAGALGARDAGDDACDVRSCPQCTPQCSPMRCTAQCDSAALNAECETVFGCANSFYPQTASCVAECEAAQCQWVYADSGVAFESHCPAVLTGRTVVNLERCDDDCTRQLVLVCPTTLDCAARCARDSHGAPYNAGHCARTARCVLDCDHPHCTVSCDAPTCTDYACTPPANCVTSCECRAGACRGSTADKCRTLPLPGDMQLPQFNMVLQPLTKVVVF